MSAATHEGNEHLLASPDVASRQAAYEALVDGSFPQMHEIIPGLFLGSERAAGVFRESAFEPVEDKVSAAREALKAANITHILNCTDGDSHFGTLP